MLRYVFLGLGMICMSPSWSITCYYTLAKDSCWLKYDVTVNVMDALTNKVLTTVKVPAGKAWVRTTFPCTTNGQKLIYNAQFSPAFWASEQGKVYVAKNYWLLPSQVNAQDSAWDVAVCYPRDFSEVPLPPEATNNCSCDFSGIPVIKPRQL